jgi:hypothetical protein
MMEKNIWKCFSVLPRRFYPYLVLIDHYADMLKKRQGWDAIYQQCERDIVSTKTEL